MEAPAEPDTDARREAAQLASEAGQAVILGDLEQARELLARAVELHPSSGDLAYRHGRVLEDLGEAAAAGREYCRSVELASEGEGADDARTRLRRLATAEQGSLPSGAVAAFWDGVASANAGLLEDAADSFTRAVILAPRWPQAIYNRGVARIRLGSIRAGAEDLRRYLELSPEAPDAQAVTGRLRELEGRTASGGPSPGTALTLGVLLPGMGQFYSGRVLGGLTVLGAASASVATGFLIREIRVRCLTLVEPGQECPPGQSLGEEVDRPYLLPFVGGAVAIALVGAIEAFLEARGARGSAVAGTALDGPGKLRVLGPSISVRRRRVELNLIGLGLE